MRSDSFRTGGLTLLVASLPLSENDCRVPRGVVSEELWRTKVINEEETARILSEADSNRSQSINNLVHGTLLIIYSANKLSRTPCVDAVYLWDGRLERVEGNPEGIQVTELGFGSLGLSVSKLPADLRTRLRRFPRSPLLALWCQYHE
jgi:hypothetical protein